MSRMNEWSAKEQPLFVEDSEETREQLLFVQDIEGTREQPLSVKVMKEPWEQPLPMENSGPWEQPLHMEEGKVAREHSLPVEESFGLREQPLPANHDEE